MRALVLIFIATFFHGIALARQQIPSLDWEKRSDWISVKTDIAPAAVGDGVTDDTKAIQKALDAMTDGSVVYLPAGTYRITKTLRISHAKRLTGILVVGNGRDTRIVWDGKRGGTMFLADGAAESIYEGMVFDGRGRAAVGLSHHCGPGHFETEVQHRHLAFVNLTNAGILAEGAPATAEVITENCLFENCGRGIALLSFNDYDYTIDGCEFHKCEIGVECRHGNAYVRNCHFEASSHADIMMMPEHGSSVRRCTSAGSKAFILFSNPVAPLTIQDCHVARWTNPGGAIILNGAPVMMFDCVFTDPPAQTPPVTLLGQEQRVIVSGNRSPQTPKVVQASRRNQIFVIPPGRRKGSVLSAYQSFLKDKVRIPTVVFDAKRDFGARGDRVTDDTAAIQKAIDAARKKGNGAIAYLPAGVYPVKSTLRLAGGHYYFGGSGFRSGLLWKGPKNGAIVAVKDPDHIVMENLAIGNHDTGMPMDNGIDILQTSSGSPSFVTYDNVTVYGMYQRDPDRKGLWLRGLSKGSVVVIPHIQGNVHVVDSAQATVLITNSYEGSLTVEGKGNRRGGFLGVLTRLGTMSPYALYVRDDQDFVASDFYIEQADNGYSFEGSGGDPPGRVTIQGAKMQLNQSAKGHLALRIRGYSGQIFIGPEQYYMEPVKMRIDDEGNEDVDVLLAGSCFYNTELAVQKGEGAGFRLYTIGNIAVSDRGTGYEPADHAGQEALGKVTRALDDLRELGALDLRLNHSSFVNKSMPAHENFDH